MKRAFLVAALAGAICAAASADIFTGFEDYNASAGGTVLSGQQGWTLPTGSVDHKVYTYAGNTLNVPQNPEGGNNFIAGVSQGATTGYARAEHPNDFSVNQVWFFSFDMLGQYNGTLPAQDYLGSFSQQPSATNKYFQTLNVWDNLNAPTSYHTNYVTAESAVPGVSPGAAWQNLLTNHWYRLTTLIDFGTSSILEVSIRDLTGGGGATVVQPSGWHLVPGNGQLPNAIRFFAGGDPGGNTMAWDNVAVIPEPASMLVLGLLALLRRR